MTREDYTVICNEFGKIELFWRDRYLTSFPAEIDPETAIDLAMAGFYRGYLHGCNFERSIREYRERQKTA
jgi:hypothetical protein